MANALQFSVKYKKNEGLLMSPSYFLEKYFFGIQIKDQYGVSMSEDNLRRYIVEGQSEMERFLDISFQKKVIKENRTFEMRDFVEWGFIPTLYPVCDAYKLEGFINDVKQIEYPSEWLSVKKNSDGKNFHRCVYIVPGSGGARTNSVVYSGITPHLGFLGRQDIPYYWTIEYVTGFDQVPNDIVDAVGMLSAMKLFHILGDIVLGAGIASLSLGIDGLSQSISTTSSATNAAYGARIQGYITDLKRILPELKKYYVGTRMLVA